MLLYTEYCSHEDCLSAGILIFHFFKFDCSQIMMFQTRMMSGRINVYDRYRDWRLDVDRMSYEVLDLFSNSFL